MRSENWFIPLEKKEVVKKNTHTQDNKRKKTKKTFSII